MIFFNEDNVPILTDNINTPLASDYMWTLSTNPELDFTLQKIKSMEEIHAPHIGLEIMGFVFYVPAVWNLLCADSETSQIDTLQMSNITGHITQAVIGNINNWKMDYIRIRVVDYQVEMKYVTPVFNKRDMICHAVSREHFVMFSMMDLYKYIKNMYIGDLT